MKKRNGFVSNSSSSSFIILGVCFDITDENINTMVYEFLNDADKLKLETYLKEEGIPLDDLDDLIDALSNCDIDHVRDEYSDDLLIGEMYYTDSGDSITITEDMVGKEMHFGTSGY